MIECEYSFNMQLYSINELTQFGVGRDTLKSWAKKGVLEPSCSTGKQLRYSEADFRNACKRSFELNSTATAKKQTVKKVKKDILTPRQKLNLIFAGM